MNEYGTGIVAAVIASCVAGALGGYAAGHILMRVKIAVIETQIAMIIARYQSELGKDGTLERVEKRLTAQISELAHRVDLVIGSRNTG